MLLYYVLINPRAYQHFTSCIEYPVDTPGWYSKTITYTVYRLTVPHSQSAESGTIAACAHVAFASVHHNAVKRIHFSPNWYVYGWGAEHARALQPWQELPDSLRIPLHSRRAIL